MGKLPAISGKAMVRILQGQGFEIVRQKGSHVSLRQGEYRTVVPLHDELAKGTLMGILKQSGMTRNRLEQLMK